MIVMAVTVDLAAEVRVVQAGDHDITIQSCERSVEGHKASVPESFADHRVAADARVVGRVRVQDHVTVQINSLFAVFISRGGEASRQPALEQRTSETC